MNEHEKRPAIEPVPLPGWLLRFMNPAMRWLARKGLGPAELAVLSFAGRKSGRRYEIPVGVLQLEEGVGVFTRENWRHNFVDGHPMTVTAGGKTRETVGHLLADPEVVADEIHRGITRHGLKNATWKLGLKVNVDHDPSQEEIIDAVKRTGISIVYLGGGALPNR